MATVGELSYEMFGIRPAPSVARFDEDGWSYDESVESRCPGCGGDIHALGKPYTSGGRQYRYAAFVCVECVQTFTLQELGVASRQALTKQRSGTQSASSTKFGAATSGEDLPTLTVGSGLAGIREWESFDSDKAMKALSQAVVRWGESLPVSPSIVRGQLPAGGTFAAHTLDGHAGSMTTLVVEHQRTLWGCASSEIRVVRPADAPANLHLVTLECSEHPPGGDDPFSVAGEVAHAGALAVFGVDPFRIGNTTASTVMRLVEMLMSPDRRIPIVLLSGTNRGDQATELVARLNGAALVATIDGDASWALSDSLGASLGCYAGAVRVYPPFEHGAPPAQSPIWVSRRIAQSGWSSVATEVVATVLTASQGPRRPRLEVDLQREVAASSLASAASEIRRLKDELQDERTAATPATNVDTEIDAIFDAQNETIARLETELDDALERNLDLEARLADAESTRQSLQVALSHQRWAEEGVGDQVVAIVDDSVEAAIERMADPTGALVCTESALRGWRDARYPDPARMLDALRRLEAAAMEWRSNNAEIGERLGPWIQNTTGLRYAGSDQELERRSLGSFSFEGRKWSRIPHIKIDDAKHSNQVGRIYFAIDSGGRRWIVDHVGQKLYGR